MTWQCAVVAVRDDAAKADQSQAARGAMLALYEASTALEAVGLAVGEYVEDGIAMAAVRCPLLLR